MAWSDAAREAAARVRKMRSWIVKQERANYPRSRSVEIIPGQFDRRELARKIRLMRRGRLPENASIIGDAAASSTARAYARRTGTKFSMPKSESVMEWERKRKRRRY